MKDLIGPEFFHPLGDEEVCRSFFVISNRFIISRLLLHASNEEPVHAVALREKLDKRAFMPRNGQFLRSVFNMKLRIASVEIR